MELTDLVNTLFQEKVFEPTEYLNDYSIEALKKVVVLILETPELFETLKADPQSAQNFLDLVGYLYKIYLQQPTSSNKELIKRKRLFSQNLSLKFKEIGTEAMLLN